MAGDHPCRDSVWAMLLPHRTEVRPLSTSARCQDLARPAGPGSMINNNGASMSLASASCARSAHRLACPPHLLPLPSFSCTRDQWVVKIRVGDSWSVDPSREQSSPACLSSLAIRASVLGACLLAGPLSVFFYFLIATWPQLQRAKVGAVGYHGANMCIHVINVTSHVLHTCKAGFLGFACGWKHHGRHSGSARTAMPFKKARFERSMSGSRSLLQAQRLHRSSRSTRTEHICGIHVV